jgi:hypothetical protein
MRTINIAHCTVNCFSQHAHTAVIHRNLVLHWDINRHIAPVSSDMQEIKFTKIKHEMSTDTVNHSTVVAACSRVLPEKLTGSQLVKKFPAFYGTRRFITAFTSASYLSLS